MSEISKLKSEPALSKQPIENISKLKASGFMGNLTKMYKSCFNPH